MKRGFPERNLEPPENYYQEPPFCEECTLKECLLDLNKACPKQDAFEERERIEYEEKKMGDENDFQEDYNDYESFLTDQPEPTEEEMEIMRARHDNHDGHDSFEEEQKSG